MGISLLQFTMVVLVGILTMTSIHKARQYHAEVNQKIDVAQRAIEERDSFLIKCQADRTEAGKNTAQCKEVLQKTISEKDAMGKKVSDLENQMQSLQNSQNTLKDQLAGAENQIIGLESQVLETKTSSDAQVKQLQDVNNSSEAQIKQLLDELKKAQEEKNSSDAQIKQLQDISDAQTKQLQEDKSSSDAQMKQLKDSSDTQIKNLQDELKKAQDDLNTTQGKLDQLAAIASNVPAGPVTPAKKDKKKKA